MDPKGVDEKKKNDGKKKERLVVQSVSKEAGNLHDSKAVSSDKTKKSNKKSSIHDRDNDKSEVTDESLKGTRGNQKKENNNKNKSDSSLKISSSEDNNNISNNRNKEFITMGSVTYVIKNNVSHINDTNNTNNNSNSNDKGNRKLNSNSESKMTSSKDNHNSNNEIRSTDNKKGNNKVYGDSKGNATSNEGNNVNNISINSDNNSNHNDNHNINTNIKSNVRNSVDNPNSSRNRSNDNNYRNNCKNAITTNNSNNNDNKTHNNKNNNNSNNNNNNNNFNNNNNNYKNNHQNNSNNTNNDTNRNNNNSNNYNDKNNNYKNNNNNNNGNSNNYNNNSNNYNNNHYTNNHPKKGNNSNSRNNNNNDSESSNSNYSSQKLGAGGGVDLRNGVTPVASEEVTKAWDRYYRAYNSKVGSTKLPIDVNNSDDRSLWFQVWSAAAAGAKGPIDFLPSALLLLPDAANLAPCIEDVINVLSKVVSKVKNESMKMKSEPSQTVRVLESVVDVIRDRLVGKTRDRAGVFDAQLLNRILEKLTAEFRETVGALFQMDNGKFTDRIDMLSDRRKDIKEYQTSIYQLAASQGFSSTPVAIEEVGDKSWSSPTVGWLMSEKWHKVEELRTHYDSTTEYAQTLEKIWTLLTFYWGMLF
jgi:hypothetical protein